MRSGKLVLGVSLALIALNARSSQAQVTVSTTADSDIGFWGTPAASSTPTYGQTVVDPTGNPLLQTVTFNIQNNNADATPFKVYVYNWNGSNITGASLFTSAAQSVAPTGNNYAPVSVDINTALTPGNTYAVLYSTIGFSGSVGNDRFETASTPAQAGQKFIYNNNQSLSNPQPGDWNKYGDFGNLAFSMTFAPAASAVPEPGSIALVAGMSLTGAAFLRRRKQIARKVA